MVEKRTIIVTKPDLRSSRSDAAYWRSRPSSRWDAEQTVSIAHPIEN
jgi:hypothetical protein